MDDSFDRGIRRGIARSILGNQAEAQRRWLRLWYRSVAPESKLSPKLSGRATADGMALRPRHEQRWQAGIGLKRLSPLEPFCDNSPARNQSPSAGNRHHGPGGKGGSQRGACPAVFASDELFQDVAFLAVLVDVEPLAFGVGSRPEFKPWFHRVGNRRGCADGQEQGNRHGD